jgi:hypothetical protein
VTPPLPTRRVKRGSGWSYYIDSEPVTSVSRIIRGACPPKLDAWAARLCADYVVNHREELSTLEPSEVIRRVENVPRERRSEAAVRGTDVHSVAERLAAGETVDVPDHLSGHVDSYMAFVRDWEPRELLTETAIIKRQAWEGGGYGGTFDLLADLGDGQRWLLDYKTTASGVFPEMALQLAGYRYADAFLDSEGAEQAMLAVDACGIVWLRADGYDLIPLTVDAQTFSYFQYAQMVARFREADRDAFVGRALERRSAA